MSLTGHVLPDAWSLYGHCASTAESYAVSYVHLIDVLTCEDWGRMMNWVRPIPVFLSPDQRLLVHGRHMTSFSFFRSHVRPEWEDPHNRDGHTLSARAHIPLPDAERLWSDLLCECVRGAFPTGVLGVMLSQKSFRRTPCVKVDLWLSSHVSPDLVLEHLRSLTSLSFVQSSRDGR